MKTPTPVSAFVPTGEVNSFQPQVKTLPSPSVDAKQQLQRKIQKKQQSNSPLLCPPMSRSEGQRRHTWPWIQLDLWKSCTTVPSTNHRHCGHCCSKSYHSKDILVDSKVWRIWHCWMDKLFRLCLCLQVQRNRQIMTSPSPVGAAEEKLYLLTSRLWHNLLSSLQKHPKISLPAQSVTGWLDTDMLRFYLNHLSQAPLPFVHPPLLITNSPIKTVMPTSHVSSVNVVKMTAISLAPSSSSSTPTPLRPASIGVSSTASLEESSQTHQGQNGASVMSLQSYGKAGRPSTTQTPSVSTVTNEVKVTFEAVNDSNSATAVDKQSTASGANTGLKNERATTFRASSEPSLLIKASPVPERVARARVTLQPLQVQSGGLLPRAAITTTINQKILCI